MKHSFAKLIFFGCGHLTLSTIFKLLCLLSTVQVNAQQVQNHSSHTIERIVSSFDAFQASSGYLIDRTAFFPGIRNYSGKSDKPEHIATVQFYQWAYARLSAAALSPAFVLPPLTSVLEQIDSRGDTIPFQVLLYDYHTFKDNALQNGDIELRNNQIHNVSGRNPLEERTVVMALPWSKNAITSPVSVFTVPSFQTNRTDIVKVETDFGDGQGWREIKSGTTVSVQYSQSETVILQTRILLNSGQHLHSFSQIEISLPIAEVRSYSIASIFTLPISGATVSVMSSCGDRTICKPLIVVEGFNSPITGNTDFMFFRNQITGNPTLPISPTGLDLVTEFELAGYDIIYVDFLDGTASLEINAEVVKSVIRMVNAQKRLAGCNQPNVVWGESMGGVLSKLALREMELAGEEHDCDKLSTFDSPLRGANVPLGYQYMAYHTANLDLGPWGIAGQLKDYVPEVADALATLQSGAARDMLIYHAEYFPQQSPEHTTFYQKMINLGALTDCEHIAISNGSQIGSGQGFSPGDTLLVIDANGQSLLNECAGFSGFWSSVVNGIATLLGNNVDLYFKVNALPAPGQPEKWVYESQINLIVLGNVINISNAYGKAVNTQPIDNAPGGYVDALDGGLTVPCNNLINFVNSRFCFVPAISTLELGPYNGTGMPLADPFMDISNNNAILSSGQTTIDRFIAWDDPIPAGAPASTFNQAHVSFSADNTALMLYELRELAELTQSPLYQTYNYGRSNVLNYNYNVAAPNPFPFSQTTNKISQEIIVGNGGKLWVNRADRIAFTANTSNPQALSGSSFTVYLSEALTCNNGTPKLIVKSGGMLQVGDWVSGTQQEGHLIAGETAEIIVENGGIAEIDDNSSIEVKDGGICKIQAGATLRIKGNAGRFIVGKGGTLTIDPGATIILETPNSKIQVEGQLVVNGDFTFSGPGYFNFEGGMEQLQLGAGYNVFNLTGMGKERRFVRLGTSVVVPQGKRFNWRAGLVEVAGGAVLANKNAGVTFSYVTMQGTVQNARAFSAEQGSTQNFYHCDFKDLRKSIYMDDCQSLVVENGVFLNNGHPVEGYNTPLANFKTVNFNNNYAEGVRWMQGAQFGMENVQFYGGSGTALILSDVPFCSIRGSYFGGHQDNLVSAAPTFSELAGSEPAIYIENGLLVVSSTTIENNTTGIKSLTLPGEDALAAAVFLIESTMLNNNTAGVFMEGDQTMGHVLADCATFINNRQSIVGRDIQLMLDSYYTSTWSGDTDVPNSFVRDVTLQGGTTTDHIKVCYQQKSASGSSRMRNNWWGIFNPSSTNPVVYDPAPHPLISLLNAVCVDSIAAEVINPRPGKNAEFCPVEGRPSGEPFGRNSPDTDCAVSTAVAISSPDQTVNWKWHEAYYALKTEADLSTGVELMRPVADLWQSDLSTYTDNCRHYIASARAIVDGVDIATGAGIMGKPSERNRPMVREIDQLTVFPNPATQQVNIVLPEGVKQITITDAQGRPVFTREMPGTLLNIAVHNWNSGLYLLRVVQNDGKVRSTKLSVMGN